MSIDIETVARNAAHVGEDGRVWLRSWIASAHVGWLDREDIDCYRARTPEGSSLGVYPSRDDAIDAILRRTR